MLLLTGGFVLGEAVILHQGTMKELAPLFAAALVLCAVAALVVWHRSIFWGRSLGIRLLPLFVLLGMARGYQEARSVLAEQGLVLEVESTYGEGRIASIEEKDAWTVLLLKQVQTKEGGLRYLQVYVEREKAEQNTAGGAENSVGKTDQRIWKKKMQAEQAERYRIGECVRVWGEFTVFEPASNPGGFDYAAYYRGQKLVWRVFARSVRRAEENVQVWHSLFAAPANGLLRFRGWASDRLKLLAGEEDGGIFSAMLLGDKSGMTEEIRDLYQKNGIAHLLAVSGLHLSLVSVAAYGLLRRAGAGYGKAAVAGGMILVIYSVLTGASPSVLRALVMTLCGFAAAYLGRTYDLLSAMGLSALLLLWHSPYLIDQAGVQLSFAAIGGIGLAKELECGREIAGGETWIEARRKVGREVVGNVVRECDGQNVGKATGAVAGEAAGWAAGHVWEQTLRLTLCMQLVTLPVVLWHFFAYPLYGIFLNLLVVPLAGIIVGSGAGGLLSSLFTIQGGAFLTGGGRAVLSWYELCCRWFMKLPGSSLLMGRPELWQIVVYYLVLGVFLVLTLKIREISGSFREYFLVFALLLGLAFLHTPAVRGLEVTVLDTGQGDGICIRTKKEVILVDGCSTDQKKLGEYSLDPFFKSKGIRSIDLAIVSHGDWDHISGLSWLMEQNADGFVNVKTLVLPEAGKGEEVYERLKRLCEKQGGHVVWAARGDNWKEAGKGKLALTCLYPESRYSSRSERQKQMQVEKTEPEIRAETDRNEHSLVFRLDYDSFHMLLTGDMSAKGEEKLLRLEQQEKGAEHVAANELETGKEVGIGKKTGNGQERKMKTETGTGDIWVLKTAHHGSAYSSSEEFLSWLKPDCAVISCGKKNRYGHPHPDTIKRLTDCGSSILLTTKSGAIIWKTDGHRIRLETMKGK